jgi:hypothetical protein
MTEWHSLKTTLCFASPPLTGGGCGEGETMPNSTVLMLPHQPITPTLGFGLLLRSTDYIHVVVALPHRGGGNKIPKRAQ